MGEARDVIALSHADLAVCDCARAAERLRVIA